MFLYTLVLWLRQLYRRRYPHGWWSRRPYFWHAGPTLDEVAAAGRAAAEAETLEYEMKMATEGGRTRAKGQHTTATSTSASHGEKPTAGKFVFLLIVLESGSLKCDHQSPRLILT
jgi:hypothetical protein